MPHLHIVKPGALTTVQDLGRWGFQDRGVPVSGAMDGLSHRLANRLVGNPEDAATLEVTLIGPTVEFEGDTLFAVTGGEFLLSMDGAEFPMNTVGLARTGSRLRFGRLRRGARAYLAVAGGIDVPCILGSRSTQLTSQMGGVEGRRLLRGDRLPVSNGKWSRQRVGFAARPVFDLPRGNARLRVILGPQNELFIESAVTTLRNGRYKITSDSNRMAYRLEGTLLQHAGAADIISDATPMGAIQVPASGQPILLMADRQTTGGYPKIATVITADLPLAAQLAPGHSMEFALRKRDEALAALADRERSLARGLETAVRRW